MSHTSHRSPTVARSSGLCGASVLAMLTGCSTGIVFGRQDASVDGAIAGDASGPGGGVWGGIAYDRAAQFTPAIVTGCDVASCRLVPSGCTEREQCGNGLDDDCNGRVDDGCVCNAGTTQRCLVAPPGVVAADGSLVGRCAFGSQTCSGRDEFGSWGGCTGGVGAVQETCNGEDDNCNGCVDEGLCCSLPANCPVAGDPRVPTVAPNGRAVVHGAELLAGATSYAWHVEGGACDRVQFATQHATSYAVEGATADDPRDAAGETLAFTPTRPGDYAVTFVAQRAGAAPFTCTFVVPVRSPGLWVETCWDTGAIDTLDPWLARANADVRPATVPGASVCTPDDCASTATPRPDWGLAATPAEQCAPPPSAPSDACANPRLIANGTARRSIVVDDPGHADRFRVFVDFRASSADAPRLVHPIVELYCGGVPSGVAGGTDLASGHAGEFAVDGFDSPGAGGSLWRVFDVSDVRGGDCVVDPVHVRGERTGSCVSRGPDRTFDGPCGSPP